MQICELQRDAPANRATHHDGTLQTQRGAKCHHGFHVQRRGQLVFGILPARRRVRLAMPGHVKGQHPVARRHLRVVEDVPVLAIIRAGRMQAYQGYAAARLFERHPAGFACDIEGGVASDDRFEFGVHVAVSRAHASRSL